MDVKHMAREIFSKAIALTESGYYFATICDICRDAFRVKPRVDR